MYWKQRSSNLQVRIGVRNEDVPNLASSLDAARLWVNTNVAPCKNDVNIRWITVGNEIIPGVGATYVTQAMQNIYNAINSIGSTDTKVTTSFYMVGLASSFPPSAGTFSSDIVEVTRRVAGFLVFTGAPLMVNMYPYFPYKSDPEHVSFEYATFQATNLVIDGVLNKVQKNT